MIFFRKVLKNKLIWKVIMTNGQNDQKCTKGNRENLCTKSKKKIKKEKIPKEGETPLEKIEESTYRARNLLFTSYDTTEPEFNFKNIDIDENQIKYLIYGKEICPKTKREHWQGFVYFFEVASIIKAKKFLKIKDGWFQYALGTTEQNRVYCSKEGKFTEHGTKPDQGKRVDLNELRDAIQNGDKTVDQIVMETPMMYHQYGRTLTKIETITLRMKWRKWMTKGFWYHGPTGVGKSHKAFEDYDPSTHYIVSIAQLARGFWTGYTGQEIVVINEFRGQIPFGELMDLVDKWPKSVDIKCNEPVPFLAKTVIITAPKPPHITYQGMAEDEGNIDQLEDRFEIIELKGKSKRKQAAILASVAGGL